MAFYGYQKAYDMVKHDRMVRVYGWMEVAEETGIVIKEMMKKCKTRLEVRKIVARKTRLDRKISGEGFFKGYSCYPVGFSSPEILIMTIIEETNGYKMGRLGVRDKMHA